MKNEEKRNDPSRNIIFIVDYEVYKYHKLELNKIFTDRGIYPIIHTRKRYIKLFGKLINFRYKIKEIIGGCCRNDKDFELGKLGKKISDLNGSYIVYCSNNCDYLKYAATLGAKICCDYYTFTRKNILTF